MTPVPILQKLSGQARRQFADPTRQWVTAIGVAVAVGIGFFLAARLGLSLLTKPDGVAVFWPASGVAAGALIALGPGAKWPVAIGAAAATIVANLLGDRTLAARGHFRLVQCRRSVACGGPDRAPVWFGFHARSAAPGPGIAGGSGLRDGHLGGQWNFGVQAVPLLDSTELDHLAALVRIRRTRHCDGCTAADRNWRGRTQSAVTE